MFKSLVGWLSGFRALTGSVAKRLLSGADVKSPRLGKEVWAVPPLNIV